MSEWVDIKTQMPPEMKGVVMWLPEEEHWSTGYLYGKDMYRTGSNKKIPLNEISHWFIPEPPKR